MSKILILTNHSYMLYRFRTELIQTLMKDHEVAAELGAAADEIAYIGDDINNLDCIRWCGVTGCPADAVPQVLAAAGDVCHREGGRGAVIDRFAAKMSA